MSKRYIVNFLFRNFILLGHFVRVDKLLAISSWPCNDVLFVLSGFFLPTLIYASSYSLPRILFPLLILNAAPRRIIKFRIHMSRLLRYSSNSQKISLRSLRLLLFWFFESPSVQLLLIFFSETLGYFTL